MIIGSIMLVLGIGGVILFLGLLTLKPKLVSRNMVIVLLTGLCLIAAAGLVILTAVTGGESLHTGG